MNSTSLHATLRESAFILAAAILLSISYSFIMKKGFFGPQQQSPQPSVSQIIVPPEFIPFEEALRLHKAGNALFVDARHKYDYDLGHIEGAVNIPLKDFDTRTPILAEVRKEDLVITYCDGAECNSSIELATQLSEAGYSNVKIFFGGWNEWQAHQLTIEKTIP